MQEKLVLLVLKYCSFYNDIDTLKSPKRAGHPRTINAQQDRVMQRASVGNIYASSAMNRVRICFDMFKRSRSESALCRDASHQQK